MKVAFSGTQSSGKTTLVNILHQDSQFKDFKLFSEITRKIHARGFKINQDGDNRTQVEIMKEHQRRIKTIGNAIYDRSSLDGLVYTDYLYRQGKVTLSTLKFAFDIFSETIEEYTYIFYTGAEIPLKKDGVRSPDMAFRKDISRIFDSYIMLFKIPVLPLKGSVEERLKFVKGALK
ncbi:MAG: ATP/GTP-binding protein [Nitrosotalea sp.]